MAECVDGLLRDKTRPPGVAPLKAALVDEDVALTLKPPTHEATHWTVRAMATTIGIAPSSVVKIWHDHGLAPHRWRSFKLSNEEMARPTRSERVASTFGGSVGSSEELSCKPWDRTGHSSTSGLVSRHRSRSNPSRPAIPADCPL